MSEPTWTDWVTAVSTAATGLFVAVGAWATIASSRRDSRRLLPVVEVSNIGGGGDIDFGSFLTVQFRITNRIDETLIVEKIVIEAPRNSRISRGENRRVASGAYQTVPAKGETNFLLSPITVNETGAYSNGLGLTQRLDRRTLDAYVVPPKGWSSGTLKFGVFVSSKADTIRHKRIVVTSAARLLSAQKNAAAASKTG